MKIHTRACIHEHSRLPIIRILMVKVVVGIKYLIPVILLLVMCEGIIMMLTMMKRRRARNQKGEE